MTTVATEPRNPITVLCQRFGQVSGWELHFTPSTASPAEIRAEIERCENCCWITEISDGSRTAGFLHLEQPDAGVLPENFIETKLLAEALARILGRLAQASTQLNQRNLDVATLLDLGLAVPAQDNLAFGLTQLLKAATHLTGSWCAAFFLLDPGAERIRLRAVFHLNRDDVPEPFRELRSGTVDLQALADQPVALQAEDAGGHPLFPAEIKSALCAAVQSETSPFGVLWVYDRRGKAYSRRDIHVLQSIAAQVAALLERSALLRGSELNDRIHRDLKAASETQSDGVLCELPRDPRFELAARCTSCFELGGDLCEVISLSGDQTAIAVGDASGNSIPAAMIMSAVRGALRTHASQECSATELVSRINRALCSITGAHQFMSLCYGVFDAAGRTFTYSNAGHPVPLLIRDNQVQMFESHGLLLGVVPDAPYESSMVELLPGDILVLYSDGITEARSQAQELFRSEGISDCIAGLSHTSAEALLELIWDRVDDHAGDTDIDDRTLLVLKVL
ncbi:MAG TPA: GAF domain-containing SpoIIE family protein phosphatase [Planctomycetaceae bacterium]|jgi:sigma-B regulation protein RsbU (phosphoserine phosphatase)